MRWRKGGAAFCLWALGMFAGCASTTSAGGDGPTAAEAAARSATAPRGDSTKAKARAPRGHPAKAPPDGLPAKLRGVVQEVKQAGGYTYLRLLRDDDGSELWAAVAKVEVAAGDRVTVRKDVLMREFFSRSLGRTFDAIVFGEVEGDVEHQAGGHSGDAFSL